MRLKLKIHACLQPTASGFPSGEQMNELRSASHDLPRGDGLATQSANSERLPSTAEDEEMQAAFGKKLSLTDISTSTIGSKGQPASPPVPISILQRTEEALECSEVYSKPSGAWVGF